MPVERIESGIPGLDKLIQGGFVKNSINLLAGQTGAGKTIFGVQYLLHGLKKGEKGLYISLGQDADELLADVASFGWDTELRNYIRQGKLLLVNLEPISMEDLNTQTVEATKKINATRFVLDSLSIAEMGWKMGELDVTKVRSETFSYMKTLKKIGLTSLLVTEIPETDVKALSRFGFEEFLADSVIKLNYLGIGEAVYNNVEIRKMRRTAHAKGTFAIDFAKDGLKVSTAKGKLHF